MQHVNLIVTNIIQSFGLRHRIYGIMDMSAVSEYPQSCYSIGFRTRTVGMYMFLNRTSTTF